MFQSVRPLIWNREVPKRAQLLIYKTFYVPFVSYGTETWVIIEREWSRLQAGEMKFFRSIVEKTRMDRVLNIDVRKELNVKILRYMVENNRFSRLGHVKRMKDGRILTKSGRNERIWETT